MLGLSLAAPLTVLIGVVIHFTQPPRPPPADEGVLAHIFQLTIVATAAMVLVFLATTDWRQPMRIVRALIIPAVAVALSFGTIYYFEHYQNYL